MSELPKGWDMAAISQLIAPDGLFADGDWIESKDQDPNGAIRLLQLADIGDGVFVDKSNRFINEEQFDRLRCTEILEDDVLIARMPAPLGRACMLPRLHQQCITVVDVAIVRPGKSSVIPNWLMHFLNAPPVREEIDLQSSGTTRRRISRGKLAQMQLPIPPLNEQKRIADKLDAILARVDACRERLDRIPGILERFRQSVLAAATSGKLTEDWRENSCNESSWQGINVGELLIDIRYGTAKKCHYEPQATPVIRIPNICDGKISHIDLKYAEFDDVERQKLSLVTGDILMIRSNGSVDLVGRSALATEADEGFLYAGYLIRLRVNQQIVDPAYLSLALSAPDARHAIELTARSTSGVNNINTEEIKVIGIKLPSLTEQNEIVRRIESLFAYTDRLEARYAATRAQVDKLIPAILTKAFCGELVPQDPNDEPGSVLLERIRAATASAATKRRRSKSVNSATGS